MSQSQQKVQQTATYLNCLHFNLNSDYLLKQVYMADHVFTMILCHSTTAMLWLNETEAVFWVTHPKRQVSHGALIQVSDLLSEICSIRAKALKYDVNTIVCGFFSPSPTDNRVLKSKLSQTIVVFNRVTLSKDHFGDKLWRNYSVGGFSPYFLATSVWA